MPTTMLTPVDRGDARPSGASRLWRKQLLPVGTIDYKGRKIEFSREYLAGIVKAFAEKAYDQVPFQLAPQGNEHTNDPERFRGEIRSLELTGEGLDLILAATEDGDRVLRENPALGVSARISEDYQRSDGRFFPAAIQHVLGTLDPRIPGMRPWEAVEAANEPGEVIDLTDAEYVSDAPEQPAQQPPADPGTPATEEPRMALTADQEARLGKLLDLPDDQFDALLAPAPEEEQLTDEELEALLADLPGDEGEDETTGTEPEGTEGEKVPAGASLSQEAQAAIDLANSRAEETSLELARVTSALNKAAYEKERDHLARTFGVPPRITDLARSVLEGEGHVVDLANGASADAGAIVRKVLTEFGKTVKALDLSGELGTPLDFSAEAEKAAEEQATTARRELVGAVRKMTGI